MRNVAHRLALPAYTPNTSQKGNQQPDSSMRLLLQGVSACNCVAHVWLVVGQQHEATELLPVVSNEY